MWIIDNTTTFIVPRKRRRPNVPECRWVCTLVSAQCTNVRTNWLWQQSLSHKIPNISGDSSVPSGMVYVCAGCMWSERIWAVKCRTDGGWCWCWCRGSAGQQWQYEARQARQGSCTTPAHHQYQTDTQDCYMLPVHTLGWPTAPVCVLDKKWILVFVILCVIRELLPRF